MNIVIQYSPKFAREYKKLSLSIKKMAEQKEKLFRLNPHDPKLKTHKLHGRFHSVGDHHIYD